MKKSRMNTVMTVIVMLVLAAAVIGGYFLLANREKKREGIDKNNMTEVQKIITRNLDESYPITPGELVKYYSRISKAYFGEHYTDDEFDSLLNQMRGLFDEELLEENPREKHKSDLKAEIDQYREAERTIISYVVQKNSFVTYQTRDSQDYAIVMASYTTREIQPQAANKKTYQQFILRKDNDKKWKILGWEQVDPNEFVGE